MAKKKELIEEPLVEVPVVEVEETPVVETPIVEAPVKQSRSNGFDEPKPQPEQIGHATRAFRG
jgi:hypothetical protein